MKFTELNLKEEILRGIEDVGFTECLTVQASTLPITLKGRDVTVQSQTGTGKTAAFLVTIFQRLLSEPAMKGRKALIVVPTRELAVQIENDAKEIGAHLDLVIGCFYGGVGYQTQETLIRRNVDIMIATPGRLLDLNGSGKLSFSKVAILVIDEADRLFDMGFLPDIRRMMRRMLPPQQRQTMLFSATLGYQARSISSEFMNRPEKVEIESEQVTVDKITQIMYHVGHREKLPLLLGILKRDKPENSLIFTNTKHEAERVSFHLRANGYESEFLIGDLPQKKRLRIINEFKEGRIPILVATDVAARGLHVEGLQLVFNYDLPGDSENYVHRIGRTARAGKSGKSISLACDDFIFNLDAIEKFIGMKIPTEPVEDSLLVRSRGSDREFRERRKSSASVSRGGSRSGQSSLRSQRNRSQSRKKVVSQPARGGSAQQNKRRPNQSPSGKRSVPKGQKARRTSAANEPVPAERQRSNPRSRNTSGSSGQKTIPRNASGPSGQKPRPAARRPATPPPQENRPSATRKKPLVQRLIRKIIGS